jgi:glyoxylase-like metal-dependent hydrolase (beta-lactamase superfamily II)
MKRYIQCLGALLLLFAGTITFSQPMQRGPYTVHTIAEHVYRIEDANESNPPGSVVGDDGQQVSMNNCSDMYLITGGKKGLLIDLSNNVKWDASATESLRSLVYGFLGDRELVITVTHNHGDHLGMLPAFRDDSRATFWIPGQEFSASDLFPVQRTTFFPAGASLDLGGDVIVKTLEVPGHTPHSTVFFLDGRDLVFTGDAIGSGSGIWLFNEESFYTYMHSIDVLIGYLENTANHVDTAKLRIFGGHFWQGDDPKGLPAQYIYDMRTLIGEMKKGTASMEDMSTFIPFLDTNFSYGTATITWNRQAAFHFAGSGPGD